MDEYKDRVALEISRLSRNIFISFFIFPLLSLLSKLIQLQWLAMFFGILFMLSFFVGWIMPGIFTVLGKPWFAHAWLRGINPIWYSAESWKQLSSGTKVGVILQSIVMSIFASIALVMTFVNTFNK